MKLMNLTIGACVLTLSASLAGCQAAPAPPAAPAAVPAQPADAAAVEKVLIENEQKINEAVAKGDLAAFKAGVADDAWMIDEASGVAPVSEFEQMLKPGVAKYTDVKLDAFKVLWVDANTAVLAYTWTGGGTFMDQPVKSPAFAHTVYTKRGDKWVAVFHQETPKVAMPAAPPAKKK